MASEKRVNAGSKAKSHGKTFERLIVGKLLEAGIEATRNWWQSLQENKGSSTKVPDITIPGIWPELGVGASGDGYRKLEQATADLEKWKLRFSRWMLGLRTEQIIPVAITRRTGERTVRVTMTLMDAIDLITRSGASPVVPVQMEWEAFVEIAKELQKVEKQDGRRKKEGGWHVVGDDIGEGC